MSLIPGVRLGPYEIVAPIGAGGMGEVYRARDTKLNRDVALKILPDAFATDADRLARFRREAQVLAALNHPNIGHIYGFEDSGSTHALVLELVEGPTLADRITLGPMALADALPVARQIAGALEAAHEQGIVHRDLKPANIKVRADGTVKVLDFGLAKALDPPGTSTADTASSPTLTADATRMGTVLGTAAYMAPEQAKGQAIDKRADIWACGAVLYEMLSGQRAFKGEGTSDTLASVLKDDVKWDALPADTPPHIRRLLHRCLEKDRKRRLRDIGDVLLELDDTGAATSSGATAPVASRSSQRVWMAAAVVFALSTIAVATWKYLEPKALLESVQFAIAPPDKTTVGNYGPGFLALSPDGRRLVMVATGEGKSQPQLWVRALDSLTPQVLSGTDDGYQPVWSPDSRSIAFIVIALGGKLKRAELTGGTPLTLAEFATGTPAWSRSGVILFTGRDLRLYRVPETGGQPVAVTELDKSRQETSHLWPIFLPDGRRFIFLARSSDASKSALFLSSLDSPSRTPLVNVLSQVAYAQGNLFYQRDGTLMAQPFDEKAGRLAGDATPVMEGIDYNAANGRAVFSVSTKGTLVYRANGGDAYAAATLTWLDRQGKSVGVVGEPGSYGLGTSQVSRDGHRLAVGRGDARTAQYDIWTVDIERDVMTRLTSDPAHDNWPVWSANGTHVIFASDRKGVSDLYQRAADGSGADELLFASPQRKRPTDVSSDGKLLLFTWDVGENKRDDVWALPLTVVGTPFSVVSTEFGERNAVFSPDQHWIAYESNESSSVQIYVQPFPSTGGRVRVSTAGGRAPKWVGDGKQIVFEAGGRFFVADVTSPLRPGVPKELFTQPHIGEWAMDPSGERFLVPIPKEVAPDATPITVVLNFVAGLGR